MSRLKKYHLPHDGYKWRSDGRDKKWPQTTKIYYKCISVEGCPAKLHFYPHTKEIQYVGEHSHPKAGGGAEEEPAAAAAAVVRPASPATATVVTVPSCAPIIPPEVYQRPVRQSTRRQRSCVDAMSYLDDESDDNGEAEEDEDGEDYDEGEEDEEEEEAYVPTNANHNNYHSTSTSPASSDTESTSAARSRASTAARGRAQTQPPLGNIEEDVAIFLGAMQSEQKKEGSPTSTNSRKRKISDEGGSPYLSEADDEDGGPPNTDNKCPHCGKVFQNRSTFVHHWRVVVQREQQRDCPICHEIISTWYNMKRHLGNVHKWSAQQIENERARITASGSPQLGDHHHHHHHHQQQQQLSPQLLQVPQQQLPLLQVPAAAHRRKKIKLEERVAGSPSTSAAVVKMEVVSAEEDDDDVSADGLDAAGAKQNGNGSIRSRRARKAAEAAIDGVHGGVGVGVAAVGRVEDMLARLVRLYEQDREEARRLADDAEKKQNKDKKKEDQNQEEDKMVMMMVVKEQELRLREERLELRERELEQREREQLARLQMREETMLLRERELELVVRERTLALALASAAAQPQQHQQQQHQHQQQPQRS